MCCSLKVQVDKDANPRNKNIDQKQINLNPLPKYLDLNKKSQRLDQNPIVHAKVYFLSSILILTSGSPRALLKPVERPDHYNVWCQRTSIEHRRARPGEPSSYKKFILLPKRYGDLGGNRRETGVKNSTPLTLFGWGEIS